VQLRYGGRREKRTAAELDAEARWMWQHVFTHRHMTQFADPVLGKIFRGDRDSEKVGDKERFRPRDSPFFLHTPTDYPGHPQYAADAVVGQSVLR
jgi:hypothetical protein